ncbi:MAG: TrkH family potassium uptake protein, partial [Trueperella pyogenes]|nr:TrkH family potassium uptake protein [Trueperella pyogenes]
MLIVFIMLIAFITCLLALPISTAADERAPFVDILFTAISAVCVTGLTVVD